MKSAVQLVRQANPAFLAAGLFCLVVLAYAPTIGNGFINLDDPVFVYSNPHVQRGFTAEGFRWAFSNMERGFWHPLTWLSLMLDSQLYGPRAAGYHLSSLLIHAVSSSVLFLFLLRICGRPWRSFFVAALFGLHPLHVESVAWVSERKDVLSGFFFFLTLWAYARYVQKSETSALESAPDSKSQVSNFKSKISNFFVCLLLFACGLMSKAMLVTVPVILLLLDWWPFQRLQFPATAPGTPQESPKNKFVALLVEKIPFVLLAVVFSFLTFTAQKDTGAVQTTDRFSVPSRLANAIVSCATYLYQTIWPASLAVFYPYPHNFHVLPVILSALTLVILTAIAFIFRHKWPYLAWGWCWYLVTLLPVIGLIQVGSQAHADRYTYIALVGVFVSLTWLACDLSQQWNPKSFALPIAGSALVLLCGSLTFHQVGFWRDSDILFRHALAVTKDNDIAHNNLGTALSRENKLDEAIFHFREAVRLRPQYFLAKANLGAALFRVNKFDEAIAVLQDVVNEHPNFGGAQKNLGAALGAKGRLPEAITHLQLATQLDPDDADAHFNLGIAFAKTGRLDDAIHEFQEVVRIKPDSTEGQRFLRAAMVSKAKKTAATAPPPRH